MFGVSSRYRAVNNVSSNPRDCDPGVEGSAAPLVYVKGRYECNRQRLLFHWREADAVDGRGLAPLLGILAFLLVEHLCGHENRRRQYGRRLRPEHRLVVRIGWCAGKADQHNENKDETTMVCHGCCNCMEGFAAFDRSDANFRSP